MSFQLHSNLFPMRSFLTLARAVNFYRDNKSKWSRESSMSTLDGPGPFPGVRFWFVNTNQVGNKDIVDPTDRHGLKTVYVHGGAK